MNRLERVELQLAALRGQRDGDVVADHLEGDLVDHLGDHRVDLAGHDRRSGLARRQVDLVQPGARPRGEQPQVVAGLGQLDRDPLQHPGELDEHPDVRGRLDESTTTRDAAHWHQAALAIRPRSDAFVDGVFVPTATGSPP